MTSRVVLCLFVLSIVMAKTVAAQTLVGWSTFETEHFRFHFPPNPRVEPKDFADRIEQAHAELRRFFGDVIRGKVNFHAWNSGSDGEKVLGRPLGFARADLLLIHATVDQTPGHELAHVFVHHAARPETSSRFVEEGTAVALDMSQRDRMAAARAAVLRMAPSLPTVPDLWRNGGRLPEDLLYPVAGAFMDRLIRQGREPFLRFLKNQTLEHARAVYGARFDDLIREFEADLLGDAAPRAQALASLRAKAQARMERDRKTFGVTTFNEIEALYQSANRDIRAAESRALLEQVVAQYPSANRAGCALLYLARISEGLDREAFLKRAIVEHEDAWFGDGAQVGPFARALLAEHYRASGRQVEALSLAEQVSVEAVDHLGRPLVDNLRALKLLKQP